MATTKLTNADCVELLKARKLTQDMVFAAEDAGTINKVEARGLQAALLKSAKLGKSKEFGIKVDSVKGVFSISLPGMAMGFSPPTEGLQAIVDNIDEIKASLAKHGAERSKTRDAYKETDAYKAAAADMFEKAAASKKAAA